MPSTPGVNQTAYAQPTSWFPGNNALIDTSRMSFAQTSATAIQAASSVRAERGSIDGTLATAGHADMPT